MYDLGYFQFRIGLLEHNPNVNHKGTLIWKDREEVQKKLALRACNSILKMCLFNINNDPCLSLYEGINLAIQGWMSWKS